MYYPVYNSLKEYTTARWHSTTAATSLLRRPRVCLVDQGPPLEQLPTAVVPVHYGFNQAQLVGGGPGALSQRRLQLFLSGYPRCKNAGAVIQGLGLGSGLGLAHAHAKCALVIIAWQVGSEGFQHHFGGGGGEV